MELKIKRLKPTDFATFAKHLAEHLAESGKNGIPIFDPDPTPRNFKSPDYKKRVCGRWRRKPTEPDWQAAWGVYDGKKMVGHLDLTATPLFTMLHRATIGIGINAAYHRLGLGSKLIQIALDYAREHELAWVDLHVFAHNKPAIELYKKFGFKKIGSQKDAFRIRGKKIDDLTMTLKL